MFAPEPLVFRLSPGLGLSGSAVGRACVARPRRGRGCKHDSPLAAPVAVWFPSGRVGDGRTATLVSLPHLPEEAPGCGAAPRRCSPFRGARPASVPFDQNGGCSSDPVPGESAPARWAFVTFAVA